MNGEFKNDATQAERRKVLKNDREATTYHQLANVDAELGGRFAKESNISGAERSVSYPLSEEGDFERWPLKSEKARSSTVGAAFTEEVTIKVGAPGEW
jgi:hypothetical protein